MPRHAIHLGAAWERVAVAGRRCRHFGRPGGVEPRDRLVLVRTGVPAGAPPLRLELNGSELIVHEVAEGRLEADVTTAVRDRNELVVTVDPAADPVEEPTQGRGRFPDAWGRIAIEIVTPD